MISPRSERLFGGAVVTKPAFPAPPNEKANHPTPFKSEAALKFSEYTVAPWASGKRQAEIAARRMADETVFMNVFAEGFHPLRRGRESDSLHRESGSVQLPTSVPDRFSPVRFVTAQRINLRIFRRQTHVPARMRIANLPCYVPFFGYSNAGVDSIWLQRVGRPSLQCAHGHVRLRNDPPEARAKAPPV